MKAIDSVKVVLVTAIAMATMAGCGESAVQGTPSSEKTIVPEKPQSSTEPVLLPEPVAPAEEMPEIKNEEPPEVSGTRPVSWMANVLDVTSDSCTIMPLDNEAAFIAKNEKQDKANKEAEYWARATNRDTGEVTKWFHGKGSVTITGLDWGRAYYLKAIRIGDDDYANTECMNPYFYIITKDKD